MKGYTDDTAVNLDIARGRYGQLRPIHLFGFNSLVGITYESIFNDGGGIYTFPATATVVACVSDAADTGLLKIEGLDSNYNPITETVTLTGVTPVNTVLPFFRINKAYVLDGLNTGNITMTINGVTAAYIGAGSAVSQSSAFTVPVGCALYIGVVSFSSGTVNNNKYLTGRASMSNAETGQHWHFWNSTWAIGHMEFSVPVPFRIPEKTDVVFDAKSSSSENEVSMYANCVLDMDSTSASLIERFWL